MYVGTHHPAKGFTLLELMVVIVIVALLFTFATLSIRTHTPEDAIKQEALRFNRLLQLAREQAILKGEDYGIEFSTREYRFLAQIENKWAPITDDKLLRLRELKHDVELDLAVEQTDIVVQSEVDPDSDAESNIKPQVYLLSSGEITPEFQLQFYIATEVIRYSVTANFDGKHTAELLQ